MFELSEKIFFFFWRPCFSSVADPKWRLFETSLAWLTANQQNGAT